ncbi:MAG: hypothetical protein ACI4B2_05350 [Parafannyhessea sp.]|uniref:hypothetical protein n=1 Tax=Parafannyhessea sp. TaxID=2847324 RepID=UPI003EFC6EAA
MVQRLDEMYRQLYREQQVRYEALLQQARSGTSHGNPPPAPSQPTSQLRRGW